MDPTHTVTLTTALTCLSVSSFISDLLNSLQQRFLVAMGTQLEFCPGIITELSNGHLERRRDRQKGDRKVKKRLNQMIKS